MCDSELVLAELACTKVVGTFCVYNQSYSLISQEIFRVQTTPIRRRTTDRSTGPCKNCSIRLCRTLHNGTTTVVWTVDMQFFRFSYRRASRNSEPTERVLPQRKEKREKHLPGGVEFLLCFCFPFPSGSNKQVSN